MLIGINQLKELRSNVSVEIEAEREINKKLTDEITALNERLIKSQTNLNALEESKEAYSKSIEECELVCESHPLFA
jgi:predicted  nucleic acid-binding Zn-ribbon protein